MIKGLLKNTPAGLQVLVLILFSLMMGSFFYSLGMLIMEPFAPISLFENADRLTAFEEHPGMVGIYRSLLLFQHLGMFILPALLFPYLLGEHPLTFLDFRGMDEQRVLFTVLIMLFFFPISNYLAQLNAGMELPGSLGWLEEKFETMQEQAQRVTEELLVAEAWPGLLRNLLFLAVLPAVGEEMLFRGALQRSIGRWSGNLHVAIWVSAFIFSAMHMQFYGFLPRFMLGALFGYLLIWTGTLWVPILAHFLNNAAAVLVSFFISQEDFEKKVENAGGQEGQTLFVLICALAVGGLLYYAKRRLGRS